MRLASCIAAALLAASSAAPARAQDCVACHTKVTPEIVKDWQLSKHSKEDVECSSCHGAGHKTDKDFANAKMPSAETCGKCHGERVKEFKSGKHAQAWAAMKAMPTLHYQPMALITGMKGCGGCHKVGSKSEEDLKAMRKDTAQPFGVSTCNACHTRHVFSLAEARSPQACATCHMGFDHPQWEMYSTSKHGVRALLKQSGVVAAEAAGPTCQTCHMPGGHHGVKTAWGFLAVRLPMPEDKKWAEDRTTVMQALGILGPDGKPTPRMEAFKSVDLIRQDQAGWQKQRDAMVKVCGDCHSVNFANAALGMGDQLIRDADRLMAEAVRIVAGLYKDGVLARPKGYAAAFPDVLAFHDAPTVIEQKLFVMMMEHRMRTFQGAFHANPDYAFWYGWSEMQRDLTEIKELAEDLRHEAGAGKKP